MNRLLLITLLSATLAGCASSPTQDSTSAATSTDGTCDREVKTGSMMPTVRCRTAAEKEMDRKSAEGAADFVRRNNQVMQPGK